MGEPTLVLSLHCRGLGEIETRVNGIENSGKDLRIDGFKNIRKKSWDFKKRDERSGGGAEKEKLEQDERME